MRQGVRRRLIVVPLCTGCRPGDAAPACAGRPATPRPHRAPNPRPGSRSVPPHLPGPALERAPRLGRAGGVARSGSPGVSWRARCGLGAAGRPGAHRDGDTRPKPNAKRRDAEMLAQTLAPPPARTLHRHGAWARRHVCYIAWRPKALMTPAALKTPNEQKLSNTCPPTCSQAGRCPWPPSGGCAAASELWHPSCAP